MATLNFSAFPSVTDLAATAGPADEIDSGWVPPDQRDRAQSDAHIQALSSIPKLAVTGQSANENVTKVVLWDCWGAATVKWTGVRQVQGSCVGAAGGNALFSLACADVLKRGDPERVEVPFWLLPYGISRMLAGMNDRGDGSLGTTFAKAVREYGHVPASTPGLPPYMEQDGFVWGSTAELDWSQGRKVPSPHLAEARKFLVRSTAKCLSPDDVREAVKSYYPVTIASNWGGQMRPSVTNGVLLNRRVTTWNHQMSVQGWWDHPQLGELFWVHNQWGIDVHGRCPSGAPGGGFWVQRKDMEYIVGQNEAFAFSAFDGFPALDAPLNFSAF